MVKGTSQVEATLNSKKIKLIALAIVKLPASVSQEVSQSVSQEVSQSVENSVKQFFYIPSNFLKAFLFRRTCLGLVLPNQYCP